MTTNQAKPLPQDLERALLVGRGWRSGPQEGPAVVAGRRGRMVDITRHAPTVSELFERADLLAVARDAEGEDLGDAAALVDAAQNGQPGPNGIRLLAPCDLQAI